ncbi:SNF1-related protein kinase regulatory subunit beta-1 [Striga hermonthica]|uniref:SNF1-related protein kinase regulatory subunit beta-1 n=1 Tax=Striga hermonthica TaxID=68872 RepID=A0A9N7MH11_STRHE|nr:SNF1-related protein kinase regulatory subunit beta-1 [Striga hermonthica]
MKSTVEMTIQILSLSKFDDPGHTMSIPPPTDRRPTEIASYPFPSHFLSLDVRTHARTDSCIQSVVRSSGGMGNANGKEEGVENGGGGDEVSGLSNHAQTARVASSDLMVSSPPHDLRQPRPPVLFSSQTPVLPSQRNGGTSSNHLLRNESRRALDYPLEKGIPTIITWSFGGNNVAVEGSWDNWKTRKLLQRSGKDHSILLVLPSGIFRYRFIVDGEVKYIPDLPSETDDIGSVCNVLDVHDYVPENLDSVAEFEPPSSPESSYSQIFPGEEDFAKDPMLVPPQLHSSGLGSDNHKEAAGSKPQHVVLNHLFMEKGQQSQSVVALGLTHRFQSKYVTVVLYKPLKR